MYMMEYGIRGCERLPGQADGHEPVLPAASCSEIWRTNVAGFQQLWFDIEAAQLGYAGTSKWDAYQAVYDRTASTRRSSTG